MSQFLRFSRRFAFPLWPWYAVGILSLALTNLIALSIPQLAKQIINAVQSAQIEPGMKTIALEIIGLGFLTIFIRAISRITIFWPGRKLEARTRSHLFQRLMQLPTNFYDRFGMGELISRLANDIGQLRAFYAFGILQILNLGFIILFTISKMMTIHVGLTLCALSPIFLMIFFMRGMMNRLHVLANQAQESLGRLTNKVTEAFVNIHVIKANAAEHTFLNQAEVESKDVYQTNVKSVVLRTVFFPLLGALINLSQVIVLFYGSYEVIHNRLSLGDILAFNVYIAYLGFPISSIGIIVSLYQRSIVALRRISAIEDSEEEGPKDEHAHNKFDLNAPLLEVKNLNFKHPVSEAGDTKTKAQSVQSFTLQNVSFSIENRQKIGIFGSIGSGKSTLFDLITRLKQPNAGEIFFHGTDITKIPPKILRKNIGYAQQSVHLFSASIRENLRFGFDGASDADLERAAAQAVVLDDIKSFDMDWDTEIGEKGIRLSGGQKQRLALARFFLRQPKLLLLDDTLSAVDQKTEQALVKQIDELQCALLVASHRTSVLQKCDEIFILDQGRIIDRGTLQDLSKKHEALRESHAN